MNAGNNTIMRVAINHVENLGTLTQSGPPAVVFVTMRYILIQCRMRESKKKLI